MDQNQQIEKIVLTCIDTAKAMLDEYGMVVPFGIRAFSDSDDLKMNCPTEHTDESDWTVQIANVVNELKGYLKNEDVSAVAVVTSLQSEDELGIGLQVETEMSSVLFVYPYQQQEGEWKIDEPVQTDQLLASVYADAAS